MKNRVFCFLFVLLIVGTSTKGFAEGPSYGYTSLENKSISKKGPYYFLKGGAFLPNNGNNDNITSGGLNNFDIGPNIEGGIGTRGEYMSLEIGLGYYSTSYKGTSDIPDISGNYEINVSAIPLTFSIIGIYPTKVFDYYLGAGAGVYFSNADLKINTNSGNGSIGDSNTSFGYHVLGGIDCNLSENIAIGVDAKWFNTTANYSNKGLSFNDYDIGGTVVRLGFKYRMW